MKCTQTGDPLYRSFDFGTLARLIMLDERLEGRSAPVRASDKGQLADTSRSMLGKVQKSWLINQLKQSKATWNLIGNQVLFTDFDRQPMGWGANMDSWQGFPVERTDILKTLYEIRPKNTLFLSGDTHSSWAFEIPLSIEDYRTNHRSVAVELGTPSITSANSDESLPLDTVKQIEQEMLDTSINPHLKYINLRDHGYLLLTVRRTELIAEWIYVDRINEPSIKENVAARMRVFTGTNFLTR